MKKLELKAPPFILQAGLFVEQEYKTYKEMATSSTDNWEYHCTYELHPRALTGRHQILQLETMLISLGKRPGGMMHDVLSAQNSITLAIQVELEDKGCFDKFKLSVGDIVVFDDSRAYNFMTNAKVKLAVVTIAKESFGPMLPYFLDACVHTLRDTDNKLANLLQNIWDEFTSSTPSKNYKDAEQKILNILEDISQTQTPKPSSLTPGEKIVYSIREQVYKHMDGNLKISELVKQYDISERNLQYSFKSLFGFTPKVFMRRLKLNLVRHDLSFETTSETTVVKVAHKWGFFHMGHFSQYYKELFEEKPSETLKRTSEHDKAFTGECVARQEEIS